jgi:hypothetical protein
MPVPQGIGVISTIKFTGLSLEDNFKKGVHNGYRSGSFPYYAQPQENLGYDDQKLGKAIDVLNKNDKVGLIVTVGGVAAAIAAKKYIDKNKYFLSVFAAAPDFDDTITGSFWGGIDLATAQYNSNRLDYLCNKLLHIKPQQVCLLSNPDNIAWRKAEEKTWTGGRIIDARDPGEFVKALSDFDKDGNLRAMIVSGAPTFQDQKDKLIGEANKYKKHVCYPFQIYANQGKVPTPNNGYHTLHGPKLATAYYHLGKKVGEALDGSKASTVDPAPLDGPHSP